MERSTGSNPFVDPARIRGDLYAEPGRLQRRSSALMRAKVGGRPAGEEIAKLALAALSRSGQPYGFRRRRRVVDVGCGSGSISRELCLRLPMSHVTMLDLSPSLLACAARRLAAAGRDAFAVRADFHRLPVASDSVDVAVAAFCLYHSLRPVEVVAELARCLRSTGTAILVTKSERSYAEIDSLVAAAGLDREAESRASLYETAHSDNLASLAASSLDVRRVIHDTNTFTFSDLSHVAEYAATNPKYRFPSDVEGKPDRIAAVLRMHVSDTSVTTTSVVTYVIGRKRTAAPPRPLRECP